MIEPLWTGRLVRERLVEAFEIDARMPNDRRHGVAAWPPVRHEFADFVGRTEEARQPLMRGVTSQEIARWSEALGWLRIIAANRLDHEYLVIWALWSARNKPLTRYLRLRGIARTTFYRFVENAAERIARELNTTTYGPVQKRVNTTS